MCFPPLPHEGVELKSCFQQLGYNVNLMDKEDGIEGAQPTRIEASVDGTSIQFKITDYIRNLRPGIYFVMNKINDMSGQPYLDSYSIFQVRSEDPTLKPLSPGQVMFDGKCDYKQGTPNWRNDMMMEFTEYFTSKHHSVTHKKKKRH